MIIVFTKDKGQTIAVLHPAPNIAIEKLIKDVPVGAKYKLMPDSTIPSDRIFRDAWTIVVDGTWSIK